MAFVLSTVAPEVHPSPTVRGPASSDERWAAWEAKGFAHDRAVRQKMLVAAPIVTVVAVVIFYVLLGR